MVTFRVMFEFKGWFRVRARLGIGLGCFRVGFRVVVRVTRIRIRV